VLIVEKKELETSNMMVFDQRPGYYLDG